MRKYFLTARTEGTFWERHSLSIVLIALMVFQTVISILAGFHVWSGEQELFGLDPSDMSEFWIWFLFEYHISLVADVFGAILLVLLTKRFREIDSAESKEQDEENEDRN